MLRIRCTPLNLIEIRLILSKPVFNLGWYNPPITLTYLITQFKHCGTKILKRQKRFKTFTTRLSFSTPLSQMNYRKGAR